MNKANEATESDQAIMRRLDDIYYEVQSVRRMTELELRARKDELEPTVLANFEGKAGETRKECYLAADGHKTQKDIVRKTGISKGTISVRMRELCEANLVEPVQQEVGNISVYRKNPSYERVFQLSKKLEAESE